MMTSIRVKYHVVSEALAAETECGDQYLVKEWNDSILIAVADGLGHGSEAAFAAKQAMKIIDAHANEPIERLVTICDQELKETRGIALTIARINNNYTLTYLAIGNVTGICWQQNELAKLSKHSLLLEGGVVGYQLPLSLKPKNFPIRSGDIFILATDGIKSQFEDAPPKLESTDKIAKLIFNSYRNENDDGLVLVAQFL